MQAFDLLVGSFCHGGFCDDIQIKKNPKEKKKPREQNKAKKKKKELHANLPNPAPAYRLPSTMQCTYSVVPPTEEVMLPELQTSTAERENCAASAGLLRSRYT